MFSKFKGPDPIIAQKCRICNSPASEISISEKNIGSHSTIDMTNGEISFSQNTKICLSGSFFIFVLEAFPVNYSSTQLKL